jgi:hypothetical protein
MDRINFGALVDALSARTLRDASALARAKGIDGNLVGTKRELASASSKAATEVAVQ